MFSIILLVFAVVLLVLIIAGVPVSQKALNILFLILVILVLVNNAGLKTRLDEVLSGVVIPPAVQAKVDAIFNASEADKAKIEAAILANTPNE